MPIRIFNEGISYKPTNPIKLRQWIIFVAKEEGFKIGDITYILCTDPFLLELNKKYLNHKTLTDIITFDYSEDNFISGDIFISIDRIFENALKFSVSDSQELLRVMVHGVLHLLGYSDKTKSEKSLMREREDHYLSLWNKRFHVKRRGS